MSTRFAYDALRFLESHISALRSEITYKDAILQRANNKNPTREPPQETRENIVLRKGVVHGSDMQSFLASKTCADLIGFLSALNSSVVVVVAPSTDPQETNWAMEFLDIAEQLVRETPLEDFDPQRFGNKAFRTWHAKLSRAVEDQDQELGTYFTKSFGDPQRLDFGTGHEVAFLMLAYCLFKRFHVQLPDISQRMIFKYLRVVRLIRSTYRLEPAGSHGVWSLDDYHFLPFILGSSQLAQGFTKPKDLLANPTPSLLVEQVDYFTDAILDILRCKRGPFREHSPLLHQLAAFDSWGEVNAGLMRMWIGEVLGKFPVAQHFWFGPSLPITWTSTTATAAMPMENLLYQNIAFHGDSGLHANDPLAKYFRTTSAVRPVSEFHADRSISFHVREDGRGINLIGDDWEISSRADAPISGEGELDSMKQQFPHELDFPFPEMLFGGNFLKMQHKDITFHFDSVFALRGCKLTSPQPDRKLIEVTMADKWKLRTDASGNAIRKWRDDFDWTFTTRNLCRVYRKQQEEQEAVKPSRTPRRIDYELLKKREEILWAKEVLLFEDDLFDMGLSKLSIKIRVMPSCLFVLSRFFLRVDQAYFRCFDCRVFHKFGQNYVLLEYSERECAFEEVKQYDSKTLNDPNAISSLLPLTMDPITYEVKI